METDNGKQYSLRWEKHAFNLASEAGCFFEDESFLDCTLSAEGQCIDAHKIILSAASSYLSNLLKIMPDKHPILIFNDIKFEQLKSLVAFIYNGSVNISENNIHDFLNAAQSLLIKGLSEESKDEEKPVESFRRTSRNVEIQDMKTNCKKNNTKLFIPKKSDFALDPGRSFKKQRQIMPKPEGSSLIECDESLSKLQEISITKYCNQNLNSKPLIRKEPENKWNEPIDERMKAPENYVVKSWKHNSVEDLNGRLKQNKNNSIKKIKLEKQTNFRIEESEEEDRKKVLSERINLNSGSSAAEAARKICDVYGPEALSNRTARKWFSRFREGKFDLSDEPRSGRPSFLDENRLNKLLRDNPCYTTRELAEKLGCHHTTIVRHMHTMGTGNNTDRTKHEESDDKIKKEVEGEQIMMVEPKQEIIEEEDTNSDYSLHASNNDSITTDAESLYESRSVSNYHHQSAVDRGIPVPLLMCRTSLSESDPVEPNWIPSIAGNFTSDHSPLVSSVDHNPQDIQCRTCAQDLPCPTCTKKYKSRYALNRHILYECGKARKSFSCDECGKKVTRQDTLQKHKLIHLVQHLKEKESEKKKKKEDDEESPKPKKIC